jgi:hypothetical protein
MPMPDGSAFIAVNSTDRRLQKPLALVDTWWSAKLAFVTKVEPTGRRYPCGCGHALLRDQAWELVGSGFAPVYASIPRQKPMASRPRYPKTRYEEQIELLMADLKRPRTRKNQNGVEETFDYFSRIVGVRGGSAGMGDVPTEFLQSHSGRPAGNDSLVKFTLQSKHEMHTKWERAIYREPGDPMRFRYPADHPLAAAFEEQTVKLEREYKGDGDYLSVRHPDEPRARDDDSDATALMAMGASGGSIGEILFA